MPILLFVLFFFLLEGYSLVYVWRAYGFVHLCFALLVAAVLGIGILRTQGRYMVMRMQQSMARGQAPTDEIIGGILSFAAGLLLLMPGFISDTIAVFLILPGFRSLAVKLFRRYMARVVAMGSGSFRVFTYGAGAGETRRTSNEEWMRDVSPRVIDVTPVSTENDEKKPEKQPEDV